MKPILFSADETDFTTNGLGRLDCISCNVVEERNGMYELEAEIPVTSPHANEIQQLSIIGAIPYEGSNVQAFVVYKISKPINGRFRVYARHLSYRLTDIPCKPFSIAASPQACAQTLAGLKSNAAESCPFNFTTDVTTGNPYVQKTPASIRKRLGGVEGSVIDQFGGEFKWDNFNVSLLKQRGRLANVTGITLRYGKNITDINQEEEIANTATGVFPFWIDTDGNNLVMIPSPDTIIYSPNAENYPYHLTQILDLSSNFQEQPTAAQLKSVAQVYVNKSDFGVPKISIKVSFVDLWKSEEYKNIAPLERVQLCDEITVDFEKLGIKALAKVVKTDYDVLKERYNSIEVGSVRTTLAQAVTDRETSIDTAFIDQFTRINGAIADATAWLTSANGYVVAVKNQDGSWKELLFMNTNNPQTATQGIRFNNNGIGFWNKAIDGGNVLDGPYGTAWTIDGRLGDFADKNFWNIRTGDFALSASATVGGQTVQQIADAAQTAAEATAAAALAATAADLQSQIDGNITSWFYPYAPTTSNAPASTWTTLADKINHIGDLFYDSTTGYCYRWQIKSTAADPTHPTANDFEWVQISDEDISAALALAQTAQDTADNKRRIFITQPVPPYDTGDLWCVGSSGDILTCTTAKTTGQTYAATDWSKLNKYVDSEDISSSIDTYDRIYLNQEKIWEKLTNTSNDCIILENGVLGLRATAMQVGKLADRYNINYWDLDTGEFKIAANAKIYDADADYSGAYVPTNSNAPASSWNTDALRRAHLGATFLNTSSKETYIYGLVYPETTHPYSSDENLYYKFITGLNAPVKIHFNSKSETESVSYDYIDLYYLDNGTYYKKRIGGTIGGMDVVIPSDTFWLHWRTDSSVTRWGWKIDSITETTETATGFSADDLPSATWTEITTPYEWYAASMSDYATKDLSQEEIFNILTDYGNVQGLFMQNGNLYINGQYIGAGTIRIGGSAYYDNPTLEIRDSVAPYNVIGSWTKDGIVANKGSFGDLQIDSSDSTIYSLGYTQLFKSTSRSSSSANNYKLNNKLSKVIGSFKIKAYFTGTIASGQSYADGTEAGTIIIQRKSKTGSSSWSNLETIKFTFNTVIQSSTSIDTSDFDTYDYRLSVTLTNVSTYLSACERRITTSDYKVFNISKEQFSGNFKGFIDSDSGNIGGWEYGQNTLYTEDNNGFQASATTQTFFLGRSGSNISLDIIYALQSGYDADITLTGGTNTIRLSTNRANEPSITRSGSGITTTDVYWRAPSDKRLKENITDLDNQLSKKFIDATMPVRFKFKKEKGTHYGMIAQDARKILDKLGETDAVLEFSQGSMNDLEDQRAINYEEYIPHLINYVKRQQAEIDELKEIVKKLSV